MTRAIDWLADATGPWLATFTVAAWALGSAVQNPTAFIPYDRAVLSPLLAIAIARLAFRGRAR